jgi:hypothetical protein
MSILVAKKYTNLVIDFRTMGGNLGGGFLVCLFFQSCMCQRGYCFGGIMWGNFKNSDLIIFKISIFTYLNHMKFNLTFMFALNFNIIYVFQFFGFNWRCEEYEVRWLCVIKETSCMKCLNWIFKMHQQTFQYQITFHMMKTMYGTHKFIIANKHSVCFHGKNMKRTIFLVFQNKNK